MTDLRLSRLILLSWRLTSSGCAFSRLSRMAAALSVSPAVSSKAEEVISKALETNPKNVKLYLQMLGRRGSNGGRE